MLKLLQLEQEEIIVSDMTVGEFIVEAYIKPLGVTRGEFARMAGMSESSLSRVINGKCEITVDVAVKLHSATGRSVKSWLIMDANRKIAMADRRVKSDVKLPLSDLIDFDGGETR